jgi:predicted transport protein
MAFEEEPDADLRIRFGRINSLKVDVAYPFLLRLYADYEADILGKPELLTILDLIESYIFRRSVCRVPTNALSKIFAALGGEVDPETYSESVLAALLLRRYNQRFPRDDEFMAMLISEDVYNSRANHYLLSRIENADRKEPVRTEDYTIEHIMPQNDDLSREWREALGADWVRVQRTYLHTLGNLTLTGYNSEYGDRPFAEKRDMGGGFTDSPLALNKDLGKAEEWNEATMRARAERLARIAMRIWRCPQLPEGVLAKYRVPEDEGDRDYTIDDHPDLSGAVGDLFELLRERILALGPSVREEFTKLYIAYKCGSNFTEIVPRKRQLQVHLDVPMDEVSDPLGLCEDISQRGHWATGGTRVTVATLDVVEDVVDLIEQAYIYRL